MCWPLGWPLLAPKRKEITKNVNGKIYFPLGSQEDILCSSALVCGKESEMAESVRVAGAVLGRSSNDHPSKSAH